MLRPWPILLAFTVLACAAAPPRASGPSVLLAFDDGKVDGSIAFPTSTHESVMRFELPPGAHPLRRLWLQPAAAGVLKWTLYDQTPLEGPGQPLHEGTVTIAADAVSNGRDGRWLVEDLSALPARQGVLWLGLRKVDGEPAVSASRADAGQYFLRNHDPKAPLNLLPVKRTPLVRLELAP